MVDAPNVAVAKRAGGAVNGFRRETTCERGGRSLRAGSPECPYWTHSFTVTPQILPPSRPTAVVVDDDRLARERIKDLNEETQLVDVVGEAADGRSAVELIDRERPDIALLDIQMPVLDGIQVLEAIAHQPAVIFTTAHGHYAVRAFELAAVDYILKPFGPDRFRTAIERARRSSSRDETPSTFERINEVMGRSSAPLARLFAREREAIVPIDVDEVVRVEASGDYVLVHTSGRRHMMRANLQDLQSDLGERFLRVHRSHLVNLDHVARFEPHDAARLAVVLSDGSRVVASRSRSQELRRLAR